MTSIYDKLKQLQYGEEYPFHMPGHKRNLKIDPLLDEIAKVDITEITGFDDLHHPEEMIRDLMDNLKQIYGTEESYLLVNSSTAGNLSAIAALCKIGDKILVARNCHKSVYHAIELLGLDPVYIYPEVDEDGICEGITKEQVEAVIKEEKMIKAMVLVSPTYEGRVSDIREISDVLHQYDIPLIVDEAHGAHFIYHEAFPESAVSTGADIVIQSLHKTLPAMTQTGLLHLCTDCVSKEMMQKKLSIFQSSSPSYVLMSSIEQCIHICDGNRGYFQQYCERLWILREKLEKLQEVTSKNFFKVRYGDIDSNMHVNNVRYVEWAVESLPLEIVLNYELKDLSVVFEKECKYGAEIIASYELREDNDELIVLHKIENDEGTELSILKSRWIKLKN